MSCKKCGNSNTNCGCKDTAYTTVRTYTCPPDTACPAPLKCSEFFDAACVYMTDGIADAGILPGSSLESIIQQLIMLVTNPACVDAPGGVPGGGTVTFIDAIWPGDAITIAGGPIQNSGTFIFNGNGNSNQYIDGQGNLQTFPAISSPVEFQTNGTPNGSQTLLNIVAGTGVTLTESNGAVTIDVDANAYTANNGLIADPADANNFQLGSGAAPGAPLIRDTYIAGAQFRFEINNANSMFLQGNRVDIESAGAGAKVLSTGGASDNSVEVTGTQVAIESVGAGSTRIFLDPTMIRVQTPLFNTKNDNDVLTLIDATTGEVEFGPVTGALFQTDGTDNADQELLNLVSGNGITLTNTGGDVTIDGPQFQTNNFDNSTQILLNLVEGNGITLTESGGSVTIDADAPVINLTTNDTGGQADYDTVTGDLNIPIYQSQIDVQDEGASRVVNPTILNFVGPGVTVTNSGLEAIVTIPGGGSGSVNANNGLIYNLTDPLNPVVQLGGPDTAPAPLLRNSWISTGDFDFHVEGNRGTKAVLNVKNIGGGSAVRGESTSGISVYGVTGSGYSGYFDATSSAIGVYSVNKGGLLAAQLESISLDTSSVLPVLMIQRTTTGTAQAGLGGTIAFSLENDADAAINVGALGYSLVSAANGNPQSKFSLSTRNGGTTANRLEVLNTGQLVLNNYTTSTSFDPDSGASVGVLNVDNTGKVFVTTGGGGPSLAVEVNGTPLSSSTLLNFVPSSDIAFTDLGGGQLSLSLVNPTVTYDSNEGVYKDTSLANDTFQLGSPGVGGSTISVPRFITTATTGTLNIIGSFWGPTAKGILHVENDSVAAGTGEQTSISGWSTGRGLSGYSNGSYVFSAGVWGSADNGYGVYAGSTNGVALKAVSQNSTALNITRSSLAAQDATVAEMAYYFRGASAGATGVGGGMKFVYDIAGAPSVNQSHEIVHKFTNVGVATQLSQYEIWGNNLGNLQQQFTILGGGTSGPAGAWTLTGGQIKFNRYAGGAIYKSANDLSTNSGFNLGIDSNGNIWATDFSTGTGGTGVQDISIGTLTNGASATVTNPAGPSATINITGQNAYTQIQADSGTAQNATAYNEAFKIVGAQGITTSIASPSNLDTVTINGPAKYLSFQLKDSGNNNISGGTYTPAAWNSTLNIRAGSGIALSNDGANPNTLIIASTGGGPTGGTVTNVSGTNANGFTFTITNPDTTPNITLGTNLTGLLVGDGTSMTAITPPTGTGVLTYNSTTNTYSYTTLPVVNDGAIVVGATAALATNLTVALQNSAGGAFTANKADSSTYRVSVGPALTDYAAKMTLAPPVGLPSYLTKSAQDTITLATPVTTFSPGTTGFNISNGISSNVTTPLAGPVVLGGVLGVSSGGTGNTTAPGNGQLLVGDGAGGFTVTNITGSGAINVTSGPGGIVISTPGLTANVKNGLYINADGSIRLGSGPNNIGGTVEFPNSMLLEPTIIRMNSQNYRLSDGVDQAIQDIGFDINDGTTTKAAYLGTSTKGFWFSAATAQAAAPSANFQGFVYGGQTTNAFPTTMGGFFHRATGSAAFPTTFGGFANDVPAARVLMGYPGTSAYQVIDRTNNFVSHRGNWGGSLPGSITDFLMYQANATSKLISIGDVSLVAGQTRFQIDDANLRYNFRKGNIYGIDYGTATPVGLNVGAIARYILATASDGKFYEIDAKGYGVITATTGTATAPTLGSTLTVVGAGGITTSISGQTLTITGSGAGSPFPYWSTLSFTATGTGTISGSSTIVPDVVGANTLNIIAGDNIAIAAVDGTTNRFSISAVVPTAGVSFGTANLTATGTGTVTGQTSIVANTASGTLGLVAGNGITFVGNSTADTITIGTTLGFTQIVGGSNGTVSVTVNNTTGVATITGPNIWNTIAVPTPGGTLPPQSNLSPEIGLDTLSFIAGPGITIATDAANDSLTISSLAATPANAWFNIVAGGQTLTPDQAQDTLTLAAGAGITITSVVGTDTITISSSAAAANAFGTIALEGGVNLLANNSSATLSMVAGTGIGISGNATSDTLTFSNTGVTSIVAGLGGTALTGAVTLAAGTNVSFGVVGNTLTINATGGGGGSANAWYTIAVANGSAAGGTGSLIPDVTQDTLTFAGGTGINISTLDTGGTLDRVVIRNTGITSIGINDGIPLTGAVTLNAGTNVTLTTTGNAVTINASGGGGGGSVTANQGVSLTGTEVRLGGNALGDVPLTSTRFISTGTFKVQVDGTPAITTANMEITSTGVGRALKLVNNSGAASDGALSAVGTVDAGTDPTSPNGTIYAQNSGKGHAIAAKSGEDTDALAAIFGIGRTGAKGYSKIASGIGVFGEAKDTILGIGVRGTAQGEYTTTLTGASSYAAWFSINPATSTNPLVASKRVEVLRLDRSISGATPGLSGDFGGTIGYYLETTAGPLSRAGQIGYTWGTAVTGDSRFKVSIVKASAPAVAETDRLELRETGQLFLSSYNGLNRVYPAPTGPANQDKGPFVPESGTTDSPTGANYTANVYDYLVPGSKTIQDTVTEQGRLDTLRNTQGKYNPTITASAGGTPFTSSTPSVRSAYFTRLNNVVQGVVRFQFISIQAAVTTGGAFDIILPVFPDANFGAPDDLLGTVTSRLNVSGQVTANGRFDDISVNAVQAAANRLRVSFDVLTAQSAGLTNEFTVQFMYTLY